MERVYVNDFRESIGLSRDPYYDRWYWDEDGLQHDYLRSKETDLQIDFSQYEKD